MLSRVLGVLGRVLIVSGLVVLGFVAFQLWGTGLEESRQQGDLAQALSDALPPDSVDTSDVDTGDPEDLAEALAPVDTATAPAYPPPPEGEPVAIIEIPRIDLARVVVQGTTRADLKKGPGHYVSTPLPGQPGNVGIAGHRTTYGAPFNRIDELVPGDDIVLSTPQGQFTYKVIPAPGSETQAWYTVKPSQSEVLADMGDNRVTLTACHPEYSARERIIVHAVLEQPPAAADPSGPVEVASAADFEEDLASTPDQLPLALAWGAAAAAVLIGGWALARSMDRTGPKLAIWVVTLAGFGFMIWQGYVHMDRYLPAI